MYSKKIQTQKCQIIQERIFYKISCFLSWFVFSQKQGSTYWKIPPPPPGGGGNKYGPRGKKYNKNNERTDKKGEKERKDKGKENKSDKMTEQKQCFIKLWETCRQKGTQYHSFSPIILIVTLKRAQKSTWGKIWYFSPFFLYFFPLEPCNNCSTFTDGVLGGKYGKREINSYFSRFFCDSICVPRVRWKEDQVRLDCSPHPLRWPCVSDFACYDF